MVAENLPALGLVDGISFAVMIWPTLLDRDDQTIMAMWDGATMSGLRLALVKGALTFVISDASGRSKSLSLRAQILCRRWYLIRFSIDATGHLFLAQRAKDPSPFSAETASQQIQLGILLHSLPKSIYFAARPGKNQRVEFHYNGKLDGPALWSGMVDDAFVVAHRMQALSGVDLSRTIFTGTSVWT